jgi:acetolactate synthase I/II/III large subunit
VTQPTVMAERLLELLEEAGVEVVFGIAGTHTIPLLGAFERRGKPRFVSARNEQGAAYMATGYARSAGRPGVILTSTGPGALNAFAGMAEAKFSSLPLFHITTFVDSGLFSGGIHESPNQTKLLEAVGAGAWKVESEAIDETFWQAWDRCISSPKGPVSLELNARLWNSPAKVGQATRAKTTTPICAPTNKLDAVIDAVRSAKTPILYVGGGVSLAGAERAVLQLAERLGAPIVTSSQGKSVADWNHPLFVGPWGQDAPVHDLLRSSDLALVIGSKLSALSTLHWQMPLPAKTYRIEPAAERHGHYGHVVPVNADAKAVCDTLLREVSEKSGGRVAAVRQVKELVLSAVKKRAPVEWGFIEAVTHGFPDDGALALDMNKASFWFMKYVPVGRKGVHSFPAYLDMGSAIPAAVGIAESGRKNVLVSVGDGGFQMGMTEIGTIAEHRYPIAMLVFNDGRYGLLHAAGASDKVRGAKELGIAIKNPDFAKFATSFDISYARVNSSGQLAQQLDRIEGPTLIETNHDFSRNW